MHAFLVTGGTTQDRTTYIDSILDADQTPVYNRVLLTPDEKASVGIGEVRAFIRKLYLSPGTQNQAVTAVIPDLSSVTTQGQQALLKTIEEPPAGVRLYLGCQSETVALPTIVSRCQIVHIRESSVPAEDTAAETAVTTLAALMRHSPGKRIETIAAIGASKEDYVVFIDTAIRVLHYRLKQDRSGTVFIQDIRVPALVLLHALLDAKTKLPNNIHPALILEHIFLTR